MNPIFIGIDPGADLGVAALINGTWYTARLSCVKQKHEHDRIYCLICAVVEWIHFQEEDKCISFYDCIIQIEDWHYQGKILNHKTNAFMHRLIGALMFTFEAHHGAKVYPPVRNVTWEKALGVSKLKNDKAKKQLLMDRFGFTEKKTMHELDACGLAEYRFNIVKRS